MQKLRTRLTDLLVIILYLGVLAIGATLAIVAILTDKVMAFIGAHPTVTTYIEDNKAIMFTFIIIWLVVIGAATILYLCYSYAR